METHDGPGASDACLEEGFTESLLEVALALVLCLDVGCRDTPFRAVSGSILDSIMPARQRDISIAALQERQITPKCCH